MSFGKAVNTETITQVKNPFYLFELKFDKDALVEIIAKILAMIPPWVRVYRIQRDIPMPLVSSGVDNGNLRELALAKMRDLNLPCRDVRTREVGIKEVHKQLKPDQIELIRRDYTASGGWETFLSYEDPKQVFFTSFRSLIFFRILLLVC